MLIIKASTLRLYLLNTIINASRALPIYIGVSSRLYKAAGSQAFHFCSIAILASNTYSTYISILFGIIVPDIIWHHISSRKNQTSK